MSNRINRTILFVIINIDSLQPLVWFNIVTTKDQVGEASESIRHSDFILHHQNLDIFFLFKGTF